MITPTPITEAAFAPYGGLVAANLQYPETIINPSSRKSAEVVPSTNLYAHAPSQIPGRAVVHVETVQPKALQKTTKRIPGVVSSSLQQQQHQNGTGRHLVIDRLERHPFTSQMFIPLGGEGVEYLAIVADGSEAADAPDLKKLKVFLVREGQGVCYGAGVWHASLSVVGKKAVTFAVVQSMNGVPEEDCDFFHLEKEEIFEIAL